MKTVTVNSNNKDEAYITTELLFDNVTRMNFEKIGGWCVKQGYTNNTEQHFITEYTNGKMWIKAVSIEGEHTYSFGAEL